jgi:ribosomal protein L7/L12
MNMSPLLAVLEFSDYGIIVLILCAFAGFVGGSKNTKIDLLKLEVQIRGLQQKLDALLKHQGIEMPAPALSDLSPELQLMAKDPYQKIAAIKRYREEHPGTGLAEAKQRIEEFGKTGR